MQCNRRYQKDQWNLDYLSLLGIPIAISRNYHFSEILYPCINIDEFKDLGKILRSVKNPDCVIVDMWNFWKENQDLSHDGIYMAKDTDI